MVSIVLQSVPKHYIERIKLIFFKEVLTLKYQMSERVIQMNSVRNCLKNTIVCRFLN